MRAILRDARYAARSLRRQPAFTAAVVATLALGIGASTAVFSLFDAALLRPLPFDEPERLVRLSGVAGPLRDERGASVLEVRDWAASNRTLSGVAGYADASLNLRTTDAADRLEGEIVAEGYFDVLGARPIAGRLFTAEEERVPDAHPVAVVSHALWRDRFGADPSLVGRAITLNDRTFTVVGVMPEGFRGLAFDTDVWVPMMMVATVGSLDDLERRGSRWLGAVGRLRDGVTPAQAQRDLDAVAERLAAAYPESNTDRWARLEPLRDFYLGDTAALLRVLLASVLLFLLIACANVVGLQLVRATSRQREMALRVAVGADRGRIVQQLLVEGLLLALVGAAAGALVALWGVDALVPLVPEGVLPGYVRVALDGRVLAFGAGLALCCGVVFGLAPVWRLSRPDLAASLKDGARTAAGGLGGGRRLGLQQSLVVAEVAVALVLLTGAGLMLRSLRHQLAVRPGFDARGVLTARVTLPAGRYDGAARVRFATALEERLAALPGARGAAVASALPLSGSWSAAFLSVPDVGAEGVRFYRHRVSPGYFDALGVPLLRGRRFTPQDDSTATIAAAIVGDATARRFWPAGDAVGRRFRLGGADGLEAVVVGVVADVRHRDLTTDLSAPAAEPDVYLPYAQFPTRDLEIAVRGTGDAAALAPALRREVAALDPTIPVFGVQPLATALRQQTATGRFASLLLGLFSGVALVLAAIGIYGVLAFLVGLSRREIAIRMALGATSTRVMLATVGRGVGLAVAGLALGLLLAASSTDVLAAQLFRVAPTDPVTFAAVSAVLLLVAVLAAWIPASRATRVDPQVALRGE